MMGAEEGARLGSYISCHEIAQTLHRDPIQGPRIVLLSSLLRIGLMMAISYIEGFKRPLKGL